MQNQDIPATVQRTLIQDVVGIDGWGARLRQMLGYLSREDVQLLQAEFYDLWWITSDELYRRHAPDRRGQ